MDTNNKCPNCGAPFENDADGVQEFSCGTEAFESGAAPCVSSYCLERTAHANTRKDRDSWQIRCEAYKQAAQLSELAAKKAEVELAQERATHAETRKRIDEIELNLRMILDMGESIRVHEGGGPEDVHKSIVVTVESLRRKLTREREKWEKLKAWASEFFHFDGRDLVFAQMNRLDAEAKEGR